ncbi:MAG: ATP-binding protein [Muribaculaceae bacterium]|nr:ATP-binding protein [Muribaculaceae bacterium]
MIVIPNEVEKYPIGQQDFRVLREDGNIYVDKTMFIHKLNISSVKYFFLARPRRFGKSLFLSTLRYFYEGRRELFENLYIDSTDWDWEEYPVLRLDLNTERYAEPGKLEEVLGNPEEAMQSMQSYFAGIDYKMKMDNENNFHNAFYLLMDLIGLDTETEVHTSDGSIDIKITTEDYMYIVELEYDKSARDALRQIDEKEYTRPFRPGARKIYKIGVNFSSSRRCIDSWEIAEEI